MPVILLVQGIHGLIEKRKQPIRAHIVLYRGAHALLTCDLLLKAKAQQDLPTPKMVISLLKRMALHLRQTHLEWEIEGGNGICRVCI